MKKEFKIAALVIVFAVFFCVLFVLSSLGGLRFFIPHHFNVAGAPFAEKNYIVLFQDNNELKPGGGVLSAYGILKFRNGLYAGLDFNDDLTLLNTDTHADYPQTVAETMKVYRAQNPDDALSGVIAVNLKGLEDALKIAGPLKSGDLEITAGNFFTTYSGENQQNIIGPLFNSIVEKTFFSPFKWRDMSDAIVKNLNEKHIMLYFFSPGLQKTIDARLWGGAWPKPKGDFLAVVTSNVSGQKTDRYLKRTVEYFVDLEEGAGRVKIMLENFNTKEQYSAEINIYLPKGTKLTKSNLSVKNEDADLYEIFTIAAEVKPGFMQTIEINFQISPDILQNKTYNLNIVKQPGTIDDNYSVVIRARPDANLRSDTLTIRENYALWRGDLVRDRGFALLAN